MIARGIACGYARFERATLREGLLLPGHRPGRRAPAGRAAKAPRRASS